ncbi:MAG TPA: nitroreductase family protein [Jatrophihabitans sp.]|jgi:nitroreductase
MTIELETAMRKRRMHREFEDRAVDPADLDIMLWSVSRAQQVRPGYRHVVVVDDPGLMKTAREVLPGFTTNNAPMMLVLCSDLSLPAVDSPGGRDTATKLDAGAACAHLGLIAQQLNMGLCTITGWSIVAVQELLGLPPHLRPDVTVAIGYPSPVKKMKSVRGPQYLPAVHHNDFGTTYQQGRS